MTVPRWMPVALALPCALVPSMGAVWILGPKLMAGDFATLSVLDLPLTLVIAAGGVLWLVGLGAPPAFRGATLLAAVLLALVRVGLMIWSIVQVLEGARSGGLGIPLRPILAVVALTHLAPAAEGLVAAAGAWGMRNAVAAAGLCAVVLGLGEMAAEAWFYQVAWGKAWVWDAGQAIGLLSWLCLVPAVIGAWLRASVVAVDLREGG